MKKILLSIISIIMLILMVVAVIVAVTVTDSGFLDLSNIVRYFCIGIAIICGIISFVTFKIALKTNNKSNKE